MPDKRTLYAIPNDVLINGIHCIMVSKTDLFLKISGFQGDNTPSAARATVIERKIPPSV